MTDPLNDLWTSAASTLDVDALAQRAASSHARQKRLFVLEGFATAVVLAFWGAMSFIAATPVVIAFGVGSALALAAWWRFLLRNQRGTWSSSSVTAAEFLAIERKRLQAADRHARMTTAAVCGLAAVLLMTMPLLWRAVPGYQSEPWRLGVAALILVAVVVATLVQAAVRVKRNEKARLELEGLDGPGWE
jgi:hypothetical protein